MATLGKGEKEREKTKKEICENEMKLVNDKVKHNKKDKWKEIRKCEEYGRAGELKLESWKRKEEKEKKRT